MATRRMMGGATRQQLGLGGEREDYGDMGFADGGLGDDALGLFGDPPAPAGSNQAPAMDLPDDDLAGIELGAGLKLPGEQKEGNTERARELGPNLAPTQPMAIPMGATTDALYESPSMDVAPPPREPAPSIMDGMPPLTLDEGYGTRRPPLETSGAASALFGDEGGGGLLGGAGGLNEGGYGLPGSGGPPAPTKMMQALLQALKLR